ncbi:MAG: uracil phosphoribosyltransferase [Flavobacteriaceae bacterium]
MKALFEGIESITDAILLSPLDGIRELELSSWAMANGLNWIFVIIGFAALIYWLKELKKYDQEGTEDYSSTSHSYLG